MTDREFDDLLKAAFERYAKETLAKLPSKEQLTLLDEKYRQSYRKIKRTRTVRRVAGVILTAACLSLFILSALLIAHYALENESLPSSAEQTVLSDVPHSDGSQTSEAQITTAVTTTTETEIPTDPSSTEPAPTTSQDTGIDKILLPSFSAIVPDFPNSGSMGEFADVRLVESELTDLTPLADGQSTDQSFSKKGGGSAEAWFGDVQVFLHYDDPVLPIAVVFTFGDKTLCPRDCVLMAQDSEGKWIKLQSYECRIGADNVTVAFYLDGIQETLSDSPRYTDFCLYYYYIAMPDEQHEVPDGKIYGFENEVQTFRFARYYVSSGSLFALSTNVQDLTIPDSFGGYPLAALRQGAISGGKAANLRSLTLPEGITSLEQGCFSGLDTLETLTLPSTLSLPITLRDRGNVEGGGDYLAEITQNTDLNGDGQIGVPFLLIFEDCTLPRIELSAENPVLTLQNGQLLLTDSGRVIYQNPGTDVPDPVEFPDETLS
ncbi:MAG: hypothetical protein ACI3YK_05515 [Eubacteriales bacterium]